MAADGVTVFVTTHYMDEAEYCRRLVLIYRGQIVASGSPSKLKRESMKGELLLVECGQLGQALEVLQTGPGVVDAAIFGSTIHVVVTNAAEAIPARQEVSFRTRRYCLEDRTDRPYPGGCVRGSHEPAGRTLGRGKEAMTLHRLAAIAWKEVLQIVRDARSVGSLSRCPSS